MTLRRTLVAAACCCALIAAAIAASVVLGGGDGTPADAATEPTPTPTATVTSTSSPAPRSTADRAELLRTCPARLPATEFDGPAPRPSDDPDWLAFQERMQVAVNTAEKYHRALPRDQQGHPPAFLWAETAVLVQVTRDAEAVRRELQARIGPGVTVRVETVRYSAPELDRLRTAIMAVAQRELAEQWAGIGWTVDNRVELSVEGDVEAARRVVAAHVPDPCSWIVEHGQRAVAAAAAGRYDPVP